MIPRKSAVLKLSKVISKKRRCDESKTVPKISDVALDKSDSEVNGSGKGTAGASDPNSDDVQKPGKRGLSFMQERLKARLQSADFRILNETLYTRTGAEAKALLDEQPHLFRTYHSGYARQVRRWPRNPLDDVISYLRTRSGTLSVADLGCGEGRLRRDVKQKVYSFDLVAHDEGIIACDISNVPLGDSSVDVAVFCLSLMGTDYGQFLVEARRVLVSNGLLLIAEVASRFANHDPGHFIRGVQALGFRHDVNHPFAKEADSGNIKAGTNGPKQKKAKSRGGVKHKKGKKNVHTDAMEGERKQSKFFFKFAFFSTKKAGHADKVGVPDATMVIPLAPCVYKKR